MDITEHFTYEEMIFSDLAERLSLPNVPNEIQRTNLEITCRQMEKVRELLGVPIFVISGFRSQYLNKLACGSSNSFHCDGLACDFKPLGWRSFDAAKKIEESGIDYDQLILEFSWIHLGFGLQERRESLTKKSTAFNEKGLIP